MNKIFKNVNHCEDVQNKNKKVVPERLELSTSELLALHSNRLSYRTIAEIFAKILTIYSQDFIKDRLANPSSR